MLKGIIGTGGLSFCVGLNLLVSSWLWRLLAPDAPTQCHLLAAGAALFLGLPMFWRAVCAMARGQRLNNDHLVTVAVFASVADQSYAQAAIISAFCQIANFLDAGFVKGLGNSIEKLARSVPSQTNRLGADGVEEAVETASLLVGEVIRVRPGQTVSVDGMVRNGRSLVSQALVTGEALPMERQTGDVVFAGSRNLTGVLDITVTAAGGQSNLGRIEAMVAEVMGAGNPALRFAEKYAGHYCLLTLSVAFLLWWGTQDLNRAVAFLVMAFPDVLFLAVPAVLVAAIACLAREGVALNNVRQLDALAKTAAIVLDKTGTLTTGELSVRQLIPADGVSSELLLSVAACAEEGSSHPFAKAIVALARRARVPFETPERNEELHGLGVRAWHGGHDILVGRERWLWDEGVHQAAPPADCRDLAGASLVGVAQDGFLLGWILSTDTLRPEAAKTVALLKELVGDELHLVTGDLQTVGDNLGDELGIPHVQGGCLPADKVETIKRLQAVKGSVVFIGDGINDAPALKSADSGIAIRQQDNDLAMSCAGLVLLRPNLLLLPFALRVARLAKQLTRQNFGIGLVWVTVGSALALSNWIGPELAAASHLFDPLLVIFNSGRLLKLKPHAPPRQ